MTTAILALEPATESCVTPASMPPSLDATLAGLRADWQAVARYIVYRSEYRRADVVLATGVNYPEALRLRVVGEAKLRAEPDYPAGCMGAALISFRLEDPEGTRVAYLKLRAEREQRETAART